MTITLRSATQSGATTKGSELTYAELDGNFQAFMGSGGAANVGFLQAGTGATAKTVQDKLREVEVSITDYGATDSNDIAAAISDIKTAYSNGCTIVIPETANYWLLNSQASTPDGTPYTIKGRGYKSKIRKGFNGDLISLGALSEMEGVYLDGQGATFTGGGVVISTGAQDAVSWRRIRNCLILDTKAEGVIFNGATTVAGHQSVISNCRIIPHDLTTAAVIWNGTQANSNVTLSNVWTESNAVANFGNVDDVQCIGCEGGEPIYTSNTTKVTFTGGRIVTSSGTLTVDGTANVIVGNTINTTAIVFASTMIHCTVLGNAIGSGTPITDNAPGSSVGNLIDIDQTLYTPVWTSTGTAPAIGNGQLAGEYRRVGSLCRASLFLIAGSTTTFGTGYWSFTLPYTAGRDQVGSCWMEDTSGIADYVGVAVVQGASNTCYVVPAANTTARVQGTVPFAWAVNDFIKINVEFPIT